MKYIFLLIIFISSINIFAQNKYDYTWKIGYGFDGKKLFNGIILDFNNDTLILTKDSILVSYVFANAAICNKNGKLICYSGGYWLEDSSSNVINNSRNLVLYNDNALKPQLERTGNFGGFQCIIMLPSPENEDSEFNVFNFQSDKLSNSVEDFLFTKVGYTENNIIIKEKCSFVTNNKRFYSAFLTACRHGNGRDWWIFAVEAMYKKAHLFLFTKDGIVQDNEIALNVPVVDTISDGVTCFTNDGKKLAMYSIYNGLWVYDFDRCNGTISNLQTIPIKGEPIDVFHNWGRGLANSPNSRFLYVSKALYMYQFDLQAKDIASSKILIGEYDGFIDTFSGFPIGFNLLQLAPNNKIYGSTTNGSRFLHVIENPDEKGLECNFRPHSLLLPAFNSFSLPNYPNFRLGAAKGSLCDTISGKPLEENTVLVYPNPYVSGDVLTLQYIGNSHAEFILFDITGRMVYRKQLEQTSISQTLQIPTLPVGNYVWKVGSTFGKLQIY